MLKKFVPPFALILTLLTYLAFALWLGLQPEALLSAFKVSLDTRGLLTEIRAFYGGIELGIAATMALLWWRGDRWGALIAGGVPLACAAAIRLLSLPIDGVLRLHLWIALAEASGGALCLWGAWLIRDRARGSILKSES